MSKKYQFKNKILQSILEIDFDKYDCIFYGDSVDERGNNLNEHIESFDTLKKFKIHQDPENLLIYTNNENIDRKRLSEEVNQYSSILIDSTTLGLAEIIFIIIGIQLAKKNNISFLYAEPKSYKSSPSNPSSPLVTFELTHNCDFQGIKGITLQYDSGDKASHIFMLGFEPGRLQNAIEQRNDIEEDYYEKYFIIGIPAFQHGWEQNTLYPHIPILDELNINEKKIIYCQANSIYSSYIALWDLYEKLGHEEKIFFVSPLGTKPHSIGAALFLSETRGYENPTSIYYDHPIRNNQRSEAINQLHLTEVIFS
ncbi:hypothetical protein ABTH16_15385 [Acinetobacter baumannii]